MKKLYFGLQTSLVFAIFINLKNIGTGIFVMTRMVHKAIDLRQIVICREDDSSSQICDGAWENSIYEIVP